MNGRQRVQWKVLNRNVKKLVHVNKRKANGDPIKRINENPSEIQKLF